MTEAEQEVVDFGKSAESLMEDKRFKKVILEGFIAQKAMSIGLDFYGSDEQIDTLKAVSAVQRHLDNAVDQKNIILMTNKG